MLRGLKKFLEMFVLLEKKTTIFSFFIEGKINNWNWLICLGPSDAQVSNCFLNVSENNSVLRFVLCY